MILLLLAAATPLPAPDETRFTKCVALIDTKADAAIAEADRWRLAGGGLLSRQCLGLAYAAQQRWAAAAVAFEQAAREGERSRDPRTAALWIEAGNAMLAAGEATKARGYFDAGLGTGTLSGAEAGEAHLDRARALVALNQPHDARTDLDQALKLVAADPLAWLLSATLARRQGDLKRAENDIGEAMQRAPDDANVALEAGNIALLQNAPAAAQTAWREAVRRAPKSAAGIAAAKALAQFDAPKP